MVARVVLPVPPFWLMMAMTATVSPHLDSGTEAVRQLYRNGAVTVGLCRCAPVPLSCCSHVQKITAEEYPHHCGNGVLGIDLGLKTFATIAYPDGTIEKVQAPEPLRRSLRSLRRSQRKPEGRPAGTGPGPGGTRAGDTPGWQVSARTSCTGCRTGSPPPPEWSRR